MALQIQMAGAMPDILERANFGGLERLGRKGWGYGKGKQKKQHGLKGSLIYRGFRNYGGFCQTNTFFFVSLCRVKYTSYICIYIDINCSTYCVF